jgi:molecular chaperone DnaK
VRITDVASHPLGIVVLDSTLRERIVPLIPQFTPLPCEKRGRFAYAYDGMTAVRVEITEGVGEVRDEVAVIGEVILDNLPPRPRGTPIEVVYRYTLNQILEVDVTDVETRQTRRATIRLRGSLSDAGLEAARKRMATASIH